MSHGAPCTLAARNEVGPKDNSRKKKKKKSDRTGRSKPASAEELLVHCQPLVPSRRELEVQIRNTLEEMLVCIKF